MRLSRPSSYLCVPGFFSRKKVPQITAIVNSIGPEIGYSSVSQHDHGNLVRN